MELAFELLREAGIRLPGPMGSTLGIVGGLIIGQAAVDAHIVSPVVVILVALTACPHLQSRMTICLCFSNGEVLFDHSSITGRVCRPDSSSADGDASFIRVKKLRSTLYDAFCVGRDGPGREMAG